MKRRKEVKELVRHTTEEIGSFRGRKEEKDVGREEEGERGRDI